MSQLHQRIEIFYDSFFLFLWIDDITKDNPEIVIRRFIRVVFGANLSPFLLKGTISHHINSYKDVDPDFVECR
jgi:hypothetical protein